VTRHVPVFRPINTPPAGRQTFNDDAGTRIETREPFATTNFAAAANAEYFAFDPAANRGLAAGTPPDPLDAPLEVAAPDFTPATLSDRQSVQFPALSLTRT